MKFHRVLKKLTYYFQGKRRKLIKERSRLTSLKLMFGIRARLYEVSDDLSFNNS